MSTASNRRVMVACVATAGAAFATGVGLPRSAARWAFEHTTFALLGVALLLLSCVVTAAFREGVLRIRSVRAAVSAFALALVLLGVVLFVVPCQFRILADETNLLGTSMSMALHGTASNATSVLWYGGTDHVLASGTPSRPCLFPFLVSVLHLLFGYRASHGFVVSGLAALGTLVAVSSFGRHLFSRAFGFAAAGLLAATPLFQLAATSSGFESLNLLLMTLIGIQTYRLLELPSALRFELVVALATLGAHCRYETVVLIVPVCIVAFLRRREISSGPWSARMPVYPLLFMPILWQRRLTTVVNEGAASGVTPFSLRYVPAHVRALFELLWSPAGCAYPTLRELCILSGLGAAVLAVRAIRHPSRRASLGLFLTLLGFALVVFVQTAFYLGDVRLAFQSRFAVSYVAGLAFLGAIPLHLAWQRIRLSRVPVALAVAGLVGHGLVVARLDVSGESLTLFREYRRNLEWLSSRPQDSTLIVTGRPGMYAAQGYSAVSFGYASRHASELAGAAERRWSDVLVIHDGPCGAEADAPGLSLPAFIPERVLEYRLSGKTCGHIERVLPRSVTTHRAALEG